MIREMSCVKGAIVLAACILVPTLLASAGTPGPRRPIEFTLAATGGDPAPIPFSLAPPASEPAGLAGPGGLGIIEDSGAPYRTALGYNALYHSTTGEGNTAVGYMALYGHGYGSNNTAVGANALLECYGGTGITAIGAGALRIAYDGADYSTAIGYGSLGGNRGPYNTAVGALAGVSYDWGQDNTVMGYRALSRAGRDYTMPSDCNTAIGSLALENLTGMSYEYGDGPTRYNTALGYKAGSSVIRGEFNIFVGANQSGMATDTNTIRIGLPYGTSVNSPPYGPVGQNRTFIAGIVESPLASGDGPSVVGITSEGRLGTMSTDLLPEGPQGPQGIPGPQGTAGEGLVPGSLLYLVAGFAPPAGYALLGTTELGLVDLVARKAIRLKINVYQKL